MQRSSAHASAAMPSMVLRISNVVSYFAFIVINTLSNQGIFGPSNADVSKKYQTPLTPAGWAFSIWAIIFTLQGLGVIYAALPFGYQFPAKRSAVNAVGFGWQLTWLFECLWLVIFPRQTLVAFIFCAIFLFSGLAVISWTLVRVYTLKGLPSGQTPFVDKPSYKAVLYGIYFLPTSINTAWLSVASCLGITVLVASQGVAMSAQVVLSACLAAAVAAVGVGVILQQGDLAYAGTLVWALAAVLSAHSGLVAQLSVMAMGVLLIVSAMAVYRKWWGGGQQQQQGQQREGEGDTAALLQESLLSEAGRSTVAPGGVAVTDTSHIHSG